MWHWYVDISLILQTVAGWSSFPDSWELGASCNDGKGAWTTTSKYDHASRVCYFITFMECEAWYWFCFWFHSRRTEKYFRRGTRLDWPEGATSRESMRAVWKLPRLPVLLLNPVVKMGVVFFAKISSIVVHCYILIIFAMKLNIVNKISIVYRTLSCSMWIARLETWSIFCKDFYVMNLQNGWRQEKL